MNFFRKVILETKYFNPNFITQNLKNIINVYLKSLSIDDLDETIFLNEKNLANSPSKFTPFSKQGVKNQLKNHFAAGYNYRQEKKNQSNVQKNVSNQPMNCQRILNYNEKSENENLPTPTNNNCTPQFVNYKKINIF